MQGDSGMGMQMGLGGMQMGNMSMGPGGMQMGNMTMDGGGMQMGAATSLLGSDREEQQQQQQQQPQRGQRSRMTSGSDFSWTGDIRRNIEQVQSSMASQNRQMQEQMNQMQNRMQDQNRMMGEHWERQNRMMQEQMAQMFNAQSGGAMFQAHNVAHNLGNNPQSFQANGWVPVQSSTMTGGRVVQLPVQGSTQVQPPQNPQQNSQGASPQGQQQQAQGDNTHSSRAAAPCINQFQYGGQNFQQRFQNQTAVEGTNGAQCSMNQNGVSVERINESVRVNGQEVYRVPANGPCAITQMNSNVYVNGVLVYTPSPETRQQVSSQMNSSGGVNVQRVGGSVLVNGIEVANVPVGEPCSISQRNGQVFVNGTCVYPRGR